MFDTSTTKIRENHCMKKKEATYCLFAKRNFLNIILATEGIIEANL
jgi:hypothetical protein